jgi:hypothetical protein
MSRGSPTPMRHEDSQAVRSSFGLGAWEVTARYGQLEMLSGDKVAVETGRHAAGHLQHRGGNAGDVLGVEDQELAGVGCRAIDQGDDVASAFRRGGGLPG